VYEQDGWGWFRRSCNSPTIEDEKQYAPLTTPGIIGCKAPATHHGWLIDTSATKTVGAISANVTGINSLAAFQRDQFKNKGTVGSMGNM
jgi:hypothetical protein